LDRRERGVGEGVDDEVGVDADVDEGVVAKVGREDVVLSSISCDCTDESSSRA